VIDPLEKSMPTEDILLTYHTYRSDQWAEEHKHVIVEHSISVMVNGETWVSLMCTPTRLEALGIGFLYNEGIIRSLDEVVSSHLCADHTIIDIWLQRQAERPKQWRRTSGCSGGMTGIDVELPVETVKSSGKIYTPEGLIAIGKKFNADQDLYRRTGGVHSSALSDGENIILHAEDVGRHNTIDKLAGCLLIDGIKVEPRALLTSGRVSSEMLQKAAQLQCEVILSRTSPTSLSVRMANQAGITLIGYARGERFSVYTHKERIQAG
jgi:FdhD protein